MPVESPESIRVTQNPGHFAGRTVVTWLSLGLNPNPDIHQPRQDTRIEQEVKDQCHKLDEQLKSLSLVRREEVASRIGQFIEKLKTCSVKDPLIHELWKLAGDHWQKEGFSSGATLNLTRLKWPYIEAEIMEPGISEENIESARAEKAKQLCQVIASRMIYVLVYCFSREFNHYVCRTTFQCARLPDRTKEERQNYWCRLCLLELKMFDPNREVKEEDYFESATVHCTQALGSVADDLGCQLYPADSEKWLITRHTGSYLHSDAFKVFREECSSKNKSHDPWARYIERSGIGRLGSDSSAAHVERHFCLMSIILYFMNPARRPTNTMIQLIEEVHEKHSTSFRALAAMIVLHGTGWAWYLQNQQ